jgi:hypothetical protein
MATASLLVPPLVVPLSNPIVSVEDQLNLRTFNLSAGCSGFRSFSWEFTRSKNEHRRATQHGITVGLHSTSIYFAKEFDRLGCHPEESERRRLVSDAR